MKKSLTGWLKFAAEVWIGYIIARSIISFLPPDIATWLVDPVGNARQKFITS